MARAQARKKGKVIQAEKSIGGPRQKVLITDDSKLNMETSNVLNGGNGYWGFSCLFS